MLVTTNGQRGVDIAAAPSRVRGVDVVAAPLHVRSVDVAVALLREMRVAATSGTAETSESDDLLALCRDTKQKSPQRRGC